MGTSVRRGYINDLFVITAVLFSAILIVAMVVADTYVTWQQQSKPKNAESQAVACTMEAKVCPDGSSVGRTGPKCEFAACPGEIK